VFVAGAFAKATLHWPAPTLDTCTHLLTRQLLCLLRQKLSRALLADITHNAVTIHDNLSISKKICSTQITLASYTDLTTHTRTRNQPTRHFSKADSSETAFTQHARYSAPNRHKPRYPDHHHTEEVCNVWTAPKSINAHRALRKVSFWWPRFNGKVFFDRSMNRGIILLPKL